MVKSRPVINQKAIDRTHPETKETVVMTTDFYISARN